MAILVMPSNRRAQVDGLANTPSGVTMGIPSTERTGVTNRRMAYSYPFDTTDLDWLISVIEPHVEVFEGLPDDWRYPELPGGLE